MGQAVHFRPPKMLFMSQPSIFQRARGRWAGVLGIVLMMAGVVGACQVPVFRYALERWEADAYELAVVVGPEGLTAEEDEVIASLRELMDSEGVRVNLRVRTVEAGSDEEPVGEAKVEAGDEEIPWSTVTPRLELFYPSKLRRFYREPVWRGPVTAESVGRVLQSPAREELVKRILAGDSAVWVMVETGNKEQDDAAAATLGKLMGEASEVLEIPDGVIAASEIRDQVYLSPADAENVLQSQIPLKVDFSMVRVSRDDPAEDVLLGMLLSVEDDLGEFADKPMAFPVFGRGRVLEPLIGAGLTGDNVMFASSYLCGACSCQVKDENPGIDLLVAANWEEAVAGSEVIVEKVLPPLEGFTGLVASAEVAVPEAGEFEEAQTTEEVKVPVSGAVGVEEGVEEGLEKVEREGISPIMVLGVAVLGILIGVLIATIRMKRSGG
jgi:hypothetical protein